MNRIIRALATLSAAAALAACGQGEHNANHGGEQQRPVDQADAAGADTSHGAEHEPGDMGRGRGVIRSVGSQGDFLTIEHGPIDGIDMNAMTMGFDILGGVDLTGFSDGDDVAFMVKRGRDNSLRVMAICNVGADGEDCLDSVADE